MVRTKCVYTYSYTLYVYIIIIIITNIQTCMYIIPHNYVYTSVCIQILMSVVMEHTIALKYVITLMEASHVDVIMVIN